MNLNLFHKIFANVLYKKGNKAHSCGIYLAPNEAVAIKYAACAIHTRKYDEVNVSQDLILKVKKLDQM